jgi:hypothetical protein
LACLKLRTNLQRSTDEVFCRRYSESCGGEKGEDGNDLHFGGCLDPVMIDTSGRSVLNTGLWYESKRLVCE